MNSVVDKIMDALESALAGVAGVNGHVFRSRELALAPENLPSLVFLLSDEETTVFSSQVDENRLIVNFEINARGDPFDKVADPIAVDLHRVLRRNQVLAGLVAEVRKKGKHWDSHEGDQTLGSVVTKYELRYLSDANDLTLSL